MVLVLDFYFLNKQIKIHLKRPKLRELHTRVVDTRLILLVMQHDSCYSMREIIQNMMPLWCTQNLIFYYKMHFGCIKVNAKTQKKVSYRVLLVDFKIRGSQRGSLVSNRIMSWKVIFKFRTVFFLFFFSNYSIVNYLSPNQFCCAVEKFANTWKSIY